MATELIYFDFAGRAEPIRILLHAAGIDFKDTRFPGKEWPAVKATTPLGAVPVLKVDGKPYSQSTALMRYASKKAGCYPSDDLEALAVDEVTESLNELMAKAPRDKSELERLRKEFQAGTMTQYSNNMEGKVQANGGCFVAGKSLTMADLVLQGTVKSVQGGSWDYIDKNFFDQYPGITATAKAVAEDALVKDYYASSQE